MSSKGLPLYLSSSSRSASAITIYTDHFRPALPRMSRFSSALPTQVSMPLAVSGDAQASLLYTHSTEYRELCPLTPDSFLAIHEYDAKLLLAYWLERAPPVAEHATVSPGFIYPSPKVAQITWDPQTNAITPDTQLPQWVHTTKLVAKPDQLIKRRGKSGLLLLNKEWDAAKQWIQERAGKQVQVSARPSHQQDPVFDCLASRHNLHTNRTRHCRLLARASRLISALLVP
jgi:hypothetical protein